MTAPTIPDTPESWSTASKGYATHVAPLMMESYAAEFCDRLDAGPEHVALEVAAGSGALTTTLAPRVKSLLATDFSPGMIEILKEKMAESANVQVQTMNGQNLELEDATFDRAACCFGLMLFPERDKGFAELRRVVKSGGKVMVSGWAGPDKFEGFALFLSALQRAFPDMPAPPTPPPVFSLANLDTFKAEMETAGFVDVETAYVARDLELPGFEDIWGMMTSGAPPVQMLFDKVGAAGKDKVEGTLREIVSERFGDDPIRVKNVATVGVGVVP